MGRSLLLSHGNSMQVRFQQRCVKGQFEHFLITVPRFHGVMQTAKDESVVNEIRFAGDGQGEGLRRHVRFNQSELFPAVQQVDRNSDIFAFELRHQKPEPVADGLLNLPQFFFS